MLINRDANAIYLYLHIKKGTADSDRASSLVWGGWGGNF